MYRVTNYLLYNNQILLCSSSCLHICLCVPIIKTFLYVCKLLLHFKLSKDCGQILLIYNIIYLYVNNGSVTRDI